MKGYIYMSFATCDPCAMCSVSRLLVYHCQWVQPANSFLMIDLVHPKPDDSVFRFPLTTSCLGLVTSSINRTKSAIVRKNQMMKEVTILGSTVLFLRLFLKVWIILSTCLVYYWIWVPPAAMRTKLSWLKVCWIWTSHWPSLKAQLAIAMSSNPENDQATYSVHCPPTTIH